jgi:hypothetical protein
MKDGRGHHVRFVTCRVSEGEIAHLLCEWGNELDDLDESDVERRAFIESRLRDLRTHLAATRAA